LFSRDKEDSVHVLERVKPITKSKPNVFPAQQSPAMDGRRERLLASLLGGGGAVIGLVLYQAIPELVRHPVLRLRIGNAVVFLLMVFAVGAVGGRLGHWFFLQLNSPLRHRGIVVGTITGLAISLAGWTIAFVLRTSLFPFVTFDGFEELMKSWLLPAMIAGPIGGVLVSLSIVRWLHRRPNQPRGVRGE
jgi:hypothetical protein